MTTPPVGLILYHHVLLIAGCSVIALLWGAGGAPYAIPRPIFLIFGVISPMVQMFFSIMLSTIVFTLCPTSIYLLCPVSFVFLILLGAGSKRNRQDLKNARWEAEFVELEQALHERPDNPAFYIRKAKLLDEAGLSPEALRTYREAHQLSSKFYSEFELRQVEKRLGSSDTLLLTAADHAARAPRLIAWLPDLKIGWILCVAAAAPVYFLDHRLFVGALSVWLFVVWYNAAQGDG